MLGGIEAAVSQIGAKPNGKLQIMLENAQIGVALHPGMPGGKVLVFQITENIEVHAPMDAGAAATIARALRPPEPRPST